MMASVESNACIHDQSARSLERRSRGEITMLRKTLLLLLPILFGVSAYSHAQTVIDTSRRIDWSQAGVTGGVPNRTTPPCMTLNPGASAAQINSAIGSCRGQVVKLNAGTYNLSSGIDFNANSDVTLRG